jgi:hypothetical protein
MTDLELAQQALPKPKLNSGVFEKIGVSTFKRANAITIDDGLNMFLAGMAKAREIDAKDAARLDRFEEWLSNRAGPLLHIDAVREALE